MDEKKILDIKTVYECNRCLGSRTLHPQASLINLENPGVEQDAVKFEFYAILLIEDCPGNCGCCGRRYYDFGYATMVFLTPGEVFRMSRDNTLPGKGLLLAFDPALLLCTTLSSHIGQYSFFRYCKEEALHLSQRETACVRRYFDDIGEELHHPIDMHSRTLLSRLIELLLDYCMRFYERQFATRSVVNKDILVRFEDLLNGYFSSDRSRELGLPTVRYFADKICLSPNYFGDLIKKETGRTPQEYIQAKIIDLSKELILEPGKTVSQVAYDLGFQYSQHFNRVFKKNVGCTPNEYRKRQLSAV